MHGHLSVKFAQYLFITCIYCVSSTRFVVSCTITSENSSALSLKLQLLFVFLFL